MRCLQHGLAGGRGRQGGELADVQLVGVEAEVAGGSVTHVPLQGQDGLI